VGRSRLRRMRFAMGIQSYFCCLTASRLPGNGIVERSSRSQCLHYAPGMKVLRIRKCLIVGTRSIRRASGLLETRQGPIVLFRLGHEIPVRWPTCGKANESFHQAQSIPRDGFMAAANYKWTGSPVSSADHHPNFVIIHRVRDAYTSRQLMAVDCATHIT
jgi:hypothetical protein